MMAVLGAAVGAAVTVVVWPRLVGDGPPPLAAAAADIPMSTTGGLDGDAHRSLARATSLFRTRWSPAGEADYSFQEEVALAGGAATEAGVESKLFRTDDGRWWAVLGRSGSTTPTPGMYLLELVDNTWQPRRLLPNTDPWAKADTLFQSSTDRLLVSLRDNRSLPDNPSLSVLWELAYLGEGEWRSLSEPVPITAAQTSALTIAVDGQSQVWTAFAVDRGIVVGVKSQDSDSFFTFNLLAAGTLERRDVPTVTSFRSQNRSGIGVMWSELETGRYRFASRLDLSPLDEWRIETAYGDGVGGCPTAASNACARPRFNLKSHGNRLYAAVETKLDQDASSNPSDPRILLLTRRPTGQWTALEYSSIQEGLSQPVVVLAPQKDAVFVFAARRPAGTYVAASSLSSPRSWDPVFVPWTIASPGPPLYPTTTKQAVRPDGSLVVTTSSPRRNDVWHNELLADHVGDTPES